MILTLDYQGFYYAIKKANKGFITIKWCWKQELNPRPTDYETVALPTELFQQTTILYINFDIFTRFLL